MGDMRAHQYIPGVYPYASLVIRSYTHHVAHHYGSLRPIAFSTGFFWMPGERARGYDPNNAHTRWFVDMVKKYEDIDEASCARYLRY
jgi:hypothetical protein